MKGFLLIDKPAGMTSHDIVDRVRALTHERTVGHAGTLDPFATGLLIVAVGREYTSQLSKLVGLDKEYEAVLRLGAKSTTGDLTGVITPVDVAGSPRAGTVPSVVFASFLGPQLQTPPMYSAKKIKGKKLYELARQGKEVERKPVAITIYELEQLPFQTAQFGDSPHAGTVPKQDDSSGTVPDRGQFPNEIPFRTRVSSGTYIRTLGEDIAKKLGTEGYLTALRRTKIGPYSITDAIPLPDTHIHPTQFQQKLHESIETSQPAEDDIDEEIKKVTALLE